MVYLLGQIVQNITLAQAIRSCAAKRPETQVCTPFEMLVETVVNVFRHRNASRQCSETLPTSPTSEMFILCFVWELKQVLQSRLLGMMSPQLEMTLC